MNINKPDLRGLKKGRDSFRRNCHHIIASDILPRRQEHLQKIDDPISSLYDDEFRYYIGKNDQISKSYEIQK